MLDVVERVLIALVVSGAVTIIIYAALDHSEKLANEPKIRTLLKFALILSTLASAVYQFYSADLERKQAKQERVQADQDRKQAAADQTLSQAKIDQLTKEVKQTREESARLTIESQDKIQAARLDLAKAQSQAQINAIQSDLSDWADENFPTNAQDRVATFSKLTQNLKQAQAEAERVAQQNERQARAKFTAGAYSATYFALHFVQEAARQFATKTGQQIKIDPIDLPDDFTAKDLAGQIAFASGAVWSIKIRTDSEPVVWFSVSFTDANHANTGELRASINPTRNLLGINYSAPMPLPDPSKIEGNHDLTAYETPIKRAFQRVISIQTLYTLPQ